MLPDRLVLDIEDFPAVSYPQLVNGFGNELLDMEPVIDKLCAGKHVSDSKHHGRRKICRDGFTLRRCFNGTFLSIADTVSLATPRTIAARALCRHARLCWSGSYRHRRCSDRSRQDSCPPRNFQNTICIHRHDQADPISGNHLSSPCTVYARSDR